jgi:DNA polymerase V
MLSGITPEELVPGHLFSAPGAYERAARLAREVDRLNDRLGRDTLRVAATGTARGWAARRENRSPAYTTRWSELPVVSA